MTDEDYRRLVRLTLDSQKHFVASLTKDSGHLNFHARHGTWLHLLGLMETWDIVLGNNLRYK